MKKKLTVFIMICASLQILAQTRPIGMVGNNTSATNPTINTQPLPSATNNFVAGKLYKFINVNSKLYLGGADFTQVEGNDFKQYADGGQTNIQWMVDKQPQNNFIIKSIDESVCMAIDGEAPSQTITCVNFNSANGQKWIFENQTDGNIKIKNVLTNKYLGVEEGSFVEGARVKLSDNTQENFILWRAVEVVPERNYKSVVAGTYIIKNVNSGMYIAPSEPEVTDGVDCMQQNKETTNTGKLNFTLDLQLDGTYLIIQKNSGLCLELDNLFNKPVLNIVSNSPTLKWKITETDNKTCIIKSAFTGHILCIRDGVKNEGASITQTAISNEKLNYTQWVFDKANDAVAVVPNYDTAAIITSNPTTSSTTTTGTTTTNPTASELITADVKEGVYGIKSIKSDMYLAYEYPNLSGFALTRIEDENERKFIIKKTSANGLQYTINCEKTSKYKLFCAANGQVNINEKDNSFTFKKNGYNTYKILCNNAYPKYLSESKGGVEAKKIVLAMPLDNTYCQDWYLDFLYDIPAADLANGNGSNNTDYHNDPADSKYEVTFTPTGEWPIYGYEGNDDPIELYGELKVLASPSKTSNSLLAELNSKPLKIFDIYSNSAIEIRKTVNKLDYKESNLNMKRQFIVTKNQVDQNGYITIAGNFSDDGFGLDKIYSIVNGENGAAGLYGRKILFADLLNAPNRTTIKTDSYKEFAEFFKSEETIFLSYKITIKKL